MNRQPWVLINNELTLFCHIQPGAKQDQLSGLYDNCLKIQLKAPPVDGKANSSLIAFVAKLCGTSKSQVSIQKGFSNRRKVLTVKSLSDIPAELRQLSK